MNRKTFATLAAALTLGICAVPAAHGSQPPKKARPSTTAQAPRMPYVFAMYCFMCHKEGVQIGPIGIFDMQSKTGNQLHEQYIRNNVRFGLKAMPAFRLSEVSPRELDQIVAYMKDVADYRKTHRDYKPTPAQEGGAKK